MMGELTKKAVEAMANGIAAHRIYEETRQRAEPKPEIVEIATATPERKRRQQSHTVPRTKATKMVPVIETMFTRNQLTEKEYLALAYYRARAIAAEDSEKNESSISPDKIMGGSSGGHPIGGYIPKVSMNTWDHVQVGRMERDMLSCWQIARAVAVDDISLTEWCIRQHGGRERYDGRGRFIAMVPVGEKNVVGEALRELKSAAGRIVK